MKYLVATFTIETTADLMQASQDLLADGAAEAGFESFEDAEDFAKELRSGDVIAYRGPMGAGKTAFTRGLARGLGLEDHVSSPTFALVHQYGSGASALYHFDMYRVDGFDDLYSTGFFDYLDFGGILAIEWS